MVKWPRLCGIVHFGHVTQPLVELRNLGSIEAGASAGRWKPPVDRAWMRLQAELPGRVLVSQKFSLPWQTQIISRLVIDADQIRSNRVD